MTNPNDIQVGGDHYRKAGELQHWDMIVACGFGWEYYIGAATKYLTRVKHPEVDYGKAGHFIDKLVWLIEHHKVPQEFQTVQGFRINSDVGWGRTDVEHFLGGYFDANGIDPASVQASAIRLLMTARTREDLLAARAAVSELEPPTDADPGYVAQ